MGQQEVRSPAGHAKNTAEDGAKRTRIWVRTCQSLDANLPPLRSTSLIGGNQGNLLYQFSTTRALATNEADLTTRSYSELEKGPVEERAEWLNSECDHLVLPLSSTFRLQMLDGLGRWADLLERLTIPVTVVGIGAQLRLAEVEAGSFRPSRVTGATAGAGRIRQHEAASRRFVSAVLDHSNSIGVRGEISKRHLQHLGFPNDRIDVIGCPSLFMWGPGFRMPEEPPKLTARSPISLSFDHRVSATADLLDRTVHEHQRATVYMQERLGARMVVTGTDTRPDWKGDSRFPMQVAHPLFQSRRLVYYPTAWSWINHLREVDFACGPRLHGTVAAILAGTPAHLLVHDSRTLEIAEHHRLPFTVVEQLDGVRASDLAARLDYSRFNAAYPELFARFTAFLARNGLQNAYEGDGAALATLAASTKPAEKARPAISNARSWRTSVRKALGRVRRGVARSK